MRLVLINSDSDALRPTLSASVASRALVCDEFGVSASRLIGEAAPIWAPVPTPRIAEAAAITAAPPLASLPDGPIQVVMATLELRIIFNSGLRSTSTAPVESRLITTTEARALLASRIAPIMISIFGGSSSPLTWTTITPPRPLDGAAVIGAGAPPAPASGATPAMMKPAPKRIVSSRLKCGT
ncbi:unannotated protein [freshwater metagenome]|uniref:Unannotated protein n=1 Tax=freshwater metagenome TaxID=449393 RepID=A0A6J7P9F6_9ZZZZ